MTEKIITDYPDYDQRNFDYFFNRSDDERRLDYLRRGLTPTNNLSLYIVDDPSPEIAPGSGIPNPWDYRQRPFGAVFEKLKISHSDLWERAKETIHINNENMSLYADLVFSTKKTDSEEAKELSIKCQSSYWAVIYKTNPE